MMWSAALPGPRVIEMSCHLHIKATATTSYAEFVNINTPTLTLLSVCQESRKEAQLRYTRLGYSDLRCTIFDPTKDTVLILCSWGIIPYTLSMDDPGYRKIIDCGCCCADAQKIKTGSCLVSDICLRGTPGSKSSTWLWISEYFSDMIPRLC